MINDRCGTPKPTGDIVTAGQVAMGGIRKQAEQVTERKHPAALLRGLCLSPCLQVPVLTSLSNGLQTLIETNLFFPKFLLVLVSITATESKLGHLSSPLDFLYLVSFFIT